MSTTPGKGTTLALETATGPSVFTPIAQVTTISGPDIQIGTAETTHLTSAAKTFRPTILDGGEPSFTILYDPADSSQVNLTDMLAAPATENWKLTLADAGTCAYTFAGHLTGFSLTGMEVEGNVEAEVKIKVSGAVTITP